MAAKQRTRKTPKKATTKRGSPEAIEKRRVARALNALLTAPAGPKVDQRTERRRKRLLDELKNGCTRGRSPLKPLDVLGHANDLLAIGETLGAIQKVAGRRYKVAEVTEEVRETARQTQAAYEFDPRVWSLFGIPLDDKAAAPKANKAPRKRRAAKKK